MVASITVEKNAYGVVTFNCAEKEAILTSDFIQRHLASCGIKKDDRKNPFSLLVLGEIKGIDDCAFADYCLEHVDLSHSSVKEIGADAFCSSTIKDIILPASTKKISPFFVRGKCLESIKVNEANTNFASHNGVLYSKDYSHLIRVPEGYKQESLYVLDATVFIDDYALDGCSIKNVILPNSLKGIGNHSFQGCRFLESLTLPAEVESIGESAFAFCPRLKSFSVDEQNSHFVFSDGAIYNKEESVLFFVLSGYRGRQFTLPSTVLEIKDCAFVGCRHVERVVCNKLINRIGDFAFDNHHIKIIVLPDKELKIEENAFCPETEILRVPPKLFDSIDIRFLRFKK